MTCREAAEGRRAGGSSQDVAAARSARTLREVKPLPKARREAAIEVANKDRRVKQLLTGRTRAVLVEPNLSDPKHPDPELVVVGLYDYDKNRSAVALVDVKAKKVVGVEETDAPFQLSDEEQQEAEGLAAKEKRAREFLGRRRPNPLTRLYFPPGAVGKKRPHRHAIVFLRPTTSERRYAVVDLSSRKVVDVLESLVR